MIAIGVAHQVGNQSRESLCRAVTAFSVAIRRIHVSFLRRYSQASYQQHSRATFDGIPGARCNRAQG